LGGGGGPEKKKRGGVEQLQRHGEHQAVKLVPDKGSEHVGGKVGVWSPPKALLSSEKQVGGGGGGGKSTYRRMHGKGSGKRLVRTIPGGKKDPFENRGPQKGGGEVSLVKEDRGGLQHRASIRHPGDEGWNLEVVSKYTSEKEDLCSTGGQ